MNEAAPLRVLVVSRPSRAWGAQLRLLMTAPELLARGVELTLAIPAGNALADRWAQLALPMIELPAARDDGIRRPDGRRAGPGRLLLETARVGRDAVRLARLVRRFDLTLSFSRHAHPEVALAGLLARRPVVIEVVDIVAPGIGRRILGAASRMAAATVVNSRATGATLGNAPRSLHVIHPGVDAEKFAPGPADTAMRDRFGAGHDGALVGILGRLDPEKGIETVGDAFARAATSGRHPHLARARLIVIGDRGIGPEDYAARLEARLREQLGPQVLFTGRVEDVPGALRTLDVTVNASSAEPFGRSVLESQASGVPVVAAAGGGIPEFVSDGQTGLLFAPGDAAALADALEQVLADPELRRRIAAAARQQALERFAPEDRYDEIASLYRSVASARR